MDGTPAHPLVRRLRITTMHVREASPLATRPGLRVFASRTARTDTVVLVLHGGKAASDAAVRKHHLAYLRMAAVARRLHRAYATDDTAVWMLRNRLRGWNESTLDALADARWALHESERRHPRAQVVLVGHSLGGRAALRLAGSSRVAGVCALAPWVGADDPRHQLDGRPALLVHGTRDRVTSPKASAEYVERAGEVNPRVQFATVPGSGHAMLRHKWKWDVLVHRFVGTFALGGGRQR